MAPDLFSIDQVASQLGLNARTVRNYVHAGKLKAVRIGKQYRIARADLDALTGQPPNGEAALQSASSSSIRHVEVSSIVQIEAIAFDAASRVTNALMAATNGRPSTDEPLRIDTIYDQERARLKVILNGGVGTTASILKFLTAYLDA